MWRWNPNHGFKMCGQRRFLVQSRHAAGQRRAFAMGQSAGFFWRQGGVMRLLGHGHDVVARRENRSPRVVRVQAARLNRSGVKNIGHMHHSTRS